jgi:hypothetical protein
MNTLDLEIVKTGNSFIVRNSETWELEPDDNGNTLFDNHDDARSLLDKILFDFGTDKDNGME